MYLLGKITVSSLIPDELKGLKDIAFNLWWSWHSEAIDLYRDIDLALWEKLGKNPVRFLDEVNQKKMAIRLADEEFMKRYKTVMNNYKNYMKSSDTTWFSKNHPELKHHQIAYFSMEFGLNEVLPIYSGGLGVLSGEHCKAASDLDLPFVAIGLFYNQGYFNQHINHDGWQETNFKELNVSQLPLKPALDNNKKQITFSIPMPGRDLFIKLWQVHIGRIHLYLMDTNHDNNSGMDKLLTSRLYGGDNETRIQQEVLLGIGGIKTLDILNIKPTVYHMNEGHSSFLSLELLRKNIQENGLDYNSAKEVVSSSLVFTTHTPVPAGNDIFPLYMIDKYFNNFWNSLGISREQFLDLGLKPNDRNNFNMTVLAMNLAGKRNGVSNLHGQVTRAMFNDLWENTMEDDVPIGHVTNGIHTLTWLSPSIKHLYDKYLPKDWDELLYDEKTWINVKDIPNDELWKTHNSLKTKMIKYIRDRLRDQMISNNESFEKIENLNSLIDTDALTIGFARRFATYKRADLIFRDIERIKKILNKPDMPVQIIFAGKAHPADRPGHEIIKHINDISNSEGFIGKVFLVENYNMTIARNMVQGVDVWLNNPQRPLEASGTSGQKVCINGIPNLSVLDGWWCEGYNGKNGWVIGDDSKHGNDYYQDNADSNSLYNILESQIIPTYYDRNAKGIPDKWVKIMKASIVSNSWLFSTHRMVQDYTNNIYTPLMIRNDYIQGSKYDFIKSISTWKQSIRENWSTVKLIPEKSNETLRPLKLISGELAKINTNVYLGNINPKSVIVEIYYGPLSKNNTILNPKTAEMTISEKLDSNNYKFSASIILLDGGEYAYTLRILPYHKDLINKFEMGLIKWCT